MNCDRCEHECSITKHLTVDSTANRLSVTCCTVAAEDIEITCKRFTTKQKLVDPAATCGDCGRWELRIPSGHTCGLTGLERLPTAIACVKIEPKETTP